MDQATKERQIAPWISLPEQVRMSEPIKPIDPMAASVEALLDRLYADTLAAAGDRRHEFAVNVLLNALLSVLEAVRKEAPDQYESYVEMAVLTLRDD